MTGGAPLRPAAVARPATGDTAFVAWLLAFAFYYLAYRYPFKINSTSTSPTYSDTPTALQFGKYVIFAGIAGLYVAGRMVRGRLAPLRWPHVAEAFIATYLFGYAAIAGVLAGQRQVAQSGIFLCALPIFILFRSSPVSLPRLGRMVTIFLRLAIVTEVVQVALFLTVGRLPALAYDRSLSVRFGSVWDDPNGWAIFTPFLAGFVTARSGRAAWKVAVLAVLALMLLLTQSLTGIGAALLASGIGLTVLLTVQLRWRWLGGFGALVALLVAIVVAFEVFVVPSALFQAFWATKAGSVTQHLDSVGHAQRTTIAELLGVRPNGRYTESGYVNLAVNMGVPYVIAFLAIGGLAIRRLARLVVRHRHHPGVEVCYGALFFLVGYYLAMINLPVDNVFPVNLLAVICVLLSHEEFVTFDLHAAPGHRG